MEFGNKSTLKIRRLLRVVFLSLVGVTVVFPFYILLIESLHPNLITMPYPVELWPEEVSMSNYAYLFAKNPISKWTLNSLIISVGTSLLQMLLCSMAAFGFGRTQFRGRKTLLWLLMLMLVIPIQTRILPLFIVFSELKLLNTFWAWLPFCADAFGIYLLMQYMQAIPMDFDEAARIDGASLLKTYTSVILPQTKPALVVLVTFNFVNQWNDFLYPLIVTRSDKMYTLQLGLNNIYSSATRGEGGGMGVALAGAVISFIPTLLIYVCFQDKIIDGMNISAGVKG
ncbi:MAG: carbohydrate ABC transporter permease [Clostridia bacterium]|nr:carbohydrate ABC transporter permease [Clostridia bacterium]